MQRTFQLTVEVPDNPEKPLGDWATDRVELQKMLDEALKGYSPVLSEMHFSVSRPGDHPVFKISDFENIPVEKEVELILKFGDDLIRAVNKISQDEAGSDRVTENKPVTE
jgi:hypothetical protein